MKSTRNIIALALVAVSSFAFAASPSLMKVIANESTGTYKVLYSAAEAGKVKLSIYDSKQKLVYAETFTGVASFARQYNFSQLAEGEYTIVAEDKNGKQVEKVSYKQNKVQSIVRITKLANADNKFMLSMVNNGTETFKVNIYDANDSLIYSEKETVNGDYAKVYNLKQTKVNGVRFEIVTSSGATTVVNY